MKKRPVVALVLGGGGALGFAHVGVIEALNKHKVPIDIVVGTSMGAVVGASYCSGFSTNKMRELAKNISLKKLYDINFNLSGLVSGRNVVKMLKDVISDINTEDLPTKFVCNAVDLVSGKEIVLDKGNVIENVRASLSVPGIFVPVKKGNMVLVDGGVINNMPHDIARKMGADVVIAVDVVTKSTIGELPKTMVGYLMQSWFISQKELQNGKRKYYNVLIQPDTSGYEQLDYKGDIAEEIIDKGRIEAEKQISKIKDIISSF